MAVQVEDRRRVTIRLSILQYVITVVFSVLAVSFWVLQVVQHAKFEEMAENNHQRTLALRAPRGLVLDRTGKILVDNRGSYSISIVRERTKDLNRTIRLLSAVLGLDEAGVRSIVDRRRREIRTLEEDEPTEGKRLQLTIDADVQKAVEDGFKAAGFNGASVVLDPGNGDVLAFTSVPAYDPNAFAAGIDRVTWASLNSDELRPLNDRAIQGRYSPGSTFKMAVALAGLEEGVITPEFRVSCGGGATFYGRFFKCWKQGGHGSIDLRHAIEQSCDTYFYTVANMVGIDKINKWATLLGLGVLSGIDLPNEVQGLVPSTEWKMRVRHEKWYAGETISVGIGQGAVSVTPVSMAVYMATLANGGTRVTPHLLKATDDGTGWKPVPPRPPQSRVEIDPG